MMKPLAVLLLIASSAWAHLIPIAPSTCGLAIDLAAPGAGIAAAVDAPSPSDVVRVSYEPDASPTRSRLQICPGDAAAPSTRCATAVSTRSFTLGGASGTIALPLAFDMRMLSSGDLDTSSVPITITLAGTSAVVPFDLRTGFVVVGDAPVLGSPIDVGGAVTIVGSGTSATLPAPLGGTPLRLTLSCTLAPVPDLDQFALAPRLAKVRGTLRAAKSTLTMMLESEFSLAPDASAPTILSVTGVGGVLVEKVMSMHAGARGRTVSDDGSLTIIPIRRATERVQKIVLRGPLAAGATLATGAGDVALSAQGLTARRGIAVKANRRATKAGVRER